MRLNRFTVGIAVGAVCVIAVLAFVLTGRGGDANLVSGSAIADAAGATGRVPGANISLTASFKLGSLSSPIGMKLDGVQDFHGDNLRVAGEYTGVPKGTPGASSDGTVPLAMVGTRRILYVKTPLIGKALPDGKTWASFDEAAAAKKMGFGDPSDFDQTNPKKLLTFLRATSDRVERVGTEEIRGVQTTHYRATVEFRKYPDALPVTDRDQARQAMEKLIKTSGTSSFPMEAWVDAHHLLRRAKFDMTTMNPKTKQKEEIHMTMDLWGFGRKRAATPPPADETVDVTKLTSRTP
jgi:hypothetical protein